MVGITYFQFIIFYFKRGLKNSYRGCHGFNRPIIVIIAYRLPPLTSIKCLNIRRRCLLFYIYK